MNTVTAHNRIPIVTLLQKLPHSQQQILKSPISLNDKPPNVNQVFNPFNRIRISPLISNMGVENILLELVGACLIGGASFFVTQFFTISPFDKSWTKEKNTLAFCSVPLAVYIVSRLYFGISFYLTSKIPSKYKRLGLCSFFYLF
jgi:hypothetical protein